MNVTKPPFDNPKVRQAVAYAIPYQKIMDAVLFGLSKPMFGAEADSKTEVAWPQPTNTTPISPRRSNCLPKPAIRTASRPRCRSISALPASTSRSACSSQESLGQIGIKCTINKIPGATWRTELNKKSLPLYTNVFSGWLDYPEYFFIWCYHGKNSIFNTMSYQSKELDALIDGAVTAAAARRQGRATRKTLRALSSSPLRTFRAFRSFNPTSTSRCRRTSPATNIGSIAGLTTARWLKGDGPIVVPATRATCISGREYWSPTFAGTYREVRREGHLMLSMILKRLLGGDTEPDRRDYRYVPVHAGLARRPRGLFRRPAATAEAIEQIRVKLGLDQPLYRAIHSLCPSISLMAISAIRSPPDSRSRTSLRPGCPPRPSSRCSLLVSVAIAVPLGIPAATKPGSVIDHPCRVISTAGVSLPVFFTGLILVYVFYYLLGLAPRRSAASMCFSVRRFM